MNAGDYYMDISKVGMETLNELGILLPYMNGDGYALEFDLYITRTNVYLCKDEERLEDVEITRAEIYRILSDFLRFRDNGLNDMMYGYCKAMFSAWQSLHFSRRGLYDVFCAADPDEKEQFFLELATRCTYR